MAKEKRKDEPGDECPERLEGGPHGWMEGYTGRPDWCWFCEVERSDRRPEEDIAGCAICGEPLRPGEGPVCKACRAQETVWETGT